MRNLILIAILALFSIQMNAQDDKMITKCDTIIRHTTGVKDSLVNCKLQYDSCVYDALAITHSVNIIDSTFILGGIKIQSQSGKIYAVDLINTDFISYTHIQPYKFGMEKNPLSVLDNCSIQNTNCKVVALYYEQGTNGKWYLCEAPNGMPDTWDRPISQASQKVFAKYLKHPHTMPLGLPQTLVSFNRKWFEEIEVPKYKFKVLR